MLENKATHDNLQFRIIIGIIVVLVIFILCTNIIPTVKNLLKIMCNI